MNFSDISLQLFLMFLGIAFGAGIYEARVVLPLWFNKINGKYSANYENLAEIDSGRKFWGFITTVPLTILTIINIVLAAQSAEQISILWLTASLIVLAERIMTFSFFIPTIIKLQRNKNIPDEVVNKKIPLWINMNYLRNILMLVSWILILQVIILH
ncbi:MAG: DUF1772 domain-containing protein [Bacteroidia bacterium]|nr:DUF1772 domain-containing protein [Bacteroidia bacterium]